MWELGQWMSSAPWGSSWPTSRSCPKRATITDLVSFWDLFEWGCGPVRGSDSCKCLAAWFVCIYVYMGDCIQSWRFFWPAWLMSMVFVRSNNFDSISLHRHSSSWLHIVRSGVLRLKACSSQGLVSILLGFKHINCGHESESHAELRWVLSGDYRSTTFHCGDFSLYGANRSNLIVDL